MFSLDIIIVVDNQHIVCCKMHVEFRAIGTNFASTFQRADRVLGRARWAITFVLSFAATIPAIIRQSSKRRVDFKFMVNLYFKARGQCVIIYDMAHPPPTDYFPISDK